MTGDIRELTLSVPEAALADLRERLRRSRLPEAETLHMMHQFDPPQYAKILTEWTSTLPAV